MTSIFADDGNCIPCTVIEAGPCYVTGIKTNEKDGYNSVQLGFEEKKEKNSTNCPSREYIKPYEAICPIWDGRMFGMKVACFSCTTYQGKLPTISPYPTSGDPGTKYYRFYKQIDLRNYDLYLVDDVQPHTKGRQVHIVAFPVNCSTKEKDKIFQGQQFEQFTPDHEKFNTFFPKNKPNDYYKNGQKFFVNVNFVEKVSVDGGHWDTVKKKDH